jgi:hypothetical protein
MRKTRMVRVMEPTITVIPTFNSDHLSCFWLGNGVGLTYAKIIADGARKSLELDSFW